MSSHKIESKEKSRENVVYHIYNDRQHLKHPIPESLEVRPIGKSLTAAEWEKFFTRCLTPKLQKECEHKIDGTIIFHGEGGLDVAALFQSRFKDRFHLRMCCNSKARVDESLQLASRRGLSFHELRYKNGRNEKIILSDPALIRKMQVTTIAA